MNIDEMKVGRKLDALIAGKVMGIEVEWFHYKPKDCYRLCKKGYADNEWNAAMMEAGVPDYSTRVAAAFEVVDHLLSTDRFSCFDLQYDHADSPVVPKTLPWYAIFIPFNEEADWCSGEADTPALAICRAALKAVEGEK